MLASETCFDSVCGRSSCAILQSTTLHYDTNVMHVFFSLYIYKGSQYIGMILQWCVCV